MRAYNKKHKPKHMVVRNFRLFIAGGYYELYYYNRFTNSCRTLVDTGYTSYAMKRQEERIKNGEELHSELWW